MKGNVGMLGRGCDVVIHETATTRDLNCEEEVADNLQRPATGSKELRLRVEGEVSQHIFRTVNSSEKVTNVIIMHLKI